MDAAAATPGTGTAATETSPAPEPAVSTVTSPTEATPTAETPAAPAGAPEAYDLKPGEGHEFDKGFLESYTAVAKELNLSNEAAQKLIDQVSPAILQSQQDRLETLRSTWATESTADKEFGGDKLQENLGVAKKGLEAFGSPELKQLINETGLGNHPEIIRHFYRLGKTLKEDTVISGLSPGAQPPKDFNGQAQRLYG